MHQLARHVLSAHLNVETARSESKTELVLFTLIFTGAGSCLTTVQQCDAPVEVISQMGKVEVEYNSRWMHYSRRILTVLFIAIGAFIVIFTSLGDH